MGDDATLKPSWLARAMGHVNVGPFNRAEAAFYEFFAAHAVRDIVRPVLLDELASVPAGVLLDVGCGGGDLTADLEAEGWTTVGIDASLPQARRAGRRHLRHRYVASNADALPFPDASFDAVVSSCAVKHWPDMKAGITECARVLRAGGRLVIVEIDGGKDRGELRRFAEHTRFPRPLQPLYPTLARHSFVPLAPAATSIAEMLTLAGVRPTTSRRIEDLPFLVVAGARE